MEKIMKYLIVSIFTVQMLNGQIDTLWTKIFNGPMGGFDQAEDIVVDLDDNAYVTGQVQREDNSDIGTVKYSSDGIQLWVSFYDGPIDTDWPKAIAVDDSGKYIYVAGYTQVDENGVDHDWILIKIDADTGDTLWTRIYGSANFFEFAGHVAVGHSGDVYVAGMAGSISHPGVDAFTIRKYDKYGNLLGMVQGRDGPGAHPGAMVLDDDENVYLTGVDQIPTIIASEKYDKFLSLQWARIEMDTLLRERVATAMAVDDSGNVYIVGYCNGSWYGITPTPDDTISDYFILSYNDVSGIPRYWKEYSCPPEDSSDAATGVVVDDAGQYIYVSGFGNGRTTSLRDIWTMKIVAATGDTVWTRKFNGPGNGNDITAGWGDFGIPGPLSIPMVMDPSGTILYIAGATEETPGSNNAYLVMAYDTGGDLLGSHVYDLGYDDKPEEIVISSAGKPYVTGCGQVMFYLDDFLTVKYSLDMDLVPPVSPYIPVAEKASGSDVKLTWHKVSTDTLGNPESIDHYVIYRNTDPSFIPVPADSVAGTTDTVYIDVGALVSGESYYYLVKAVDMAHNRSAKSNMGYKFNKFFNEESLATDKNWVSLPWHSNYTTVSDLTADLSAVGDPLVKITDLRDEQAYESWIWDPDFLEWYGTDFTIQSGRGYEMVTENDTVLVLVGSNDPAGLVVLNENPSATDKNWGSIPYNAVYMTVSDITTEYSPAGDPLIKLTNLRNEQAYESWLWDPDFLEWYGANFAIERGRGYEFVTISDATWDPTEYSNRAMRELAALKRTVSDIEVRIGNRLAPDREPRWVVEDADVVITDRRSGQVAFSDPVRYRPVIRTSLEREDYRGPGVSHTVRGHLDVAGFEGLIFTAYRPARPYDVLTENMVGSGIAIKDERGAFWFNTGNFKRPWVKDEAVILIVEAVKQGRGYFAVVNFALDNTVDIQELGEIVLEPIPAAVSYGTVVTWDEIDNENIVGYSVYHGDGRLNERVITGNSCRVQGAVTLKPVVRGGYETVYGAYEMSFDDDLKAPALMPLSYACTVHPNPFSKRMIIDYALPYQTSVTVKIYDVSGKLIKTLVSVQSDPGYYTVNWSGDDNSGRKVSAGIYFVQMRAEEFEFQDKIILVR
jgi:hypothetical protein